MNRQLLIPALILPLMGCTPEPEPEFDDWGHGRIVDHEGMSVMQLRGTREEIGYAEGSMSCDALPLLFKSYLLEYLVADYDVPYEALLTMVQNTIEFEPADERELAGLWEGILETCSDEQLWIESEYLEADAEGARTMNYDDLLVSNALADMSCSSFTAWGEASATGDTLHARNFDWAIDPGGNFLDLTLLKVYESSDDGDARFASVSVPGLIGCISCITDEGVGTTMHNVGGLDRTQFTGLKPRMLVNREALLATIGAPDVGDAAEEILEARPQRTGNNLHFSMPQARATQGAGIVFEYDGAADQPDGQATRRVGGDDPDLATADATAATNHYVVREQGADPGTVGSASSAGRLATLQAGLDGAVAEGGLDANGAMELIGAVANEYTAHSVLFDHAAGELRLYVPTEVGQPAPEAEPTIFDLGTLWDDFDAE